MKVSSSVSVTLAQPLCGKERTQLSSRVSGVWLADVGTQASEGQLPPQVASLARGTCALWRCRTGMVWAKAAAVSLGSRMAGWIRGTFTSQGPGMRCTKCCPTHSHKRATRSRVGPSCWVCSGPTLSPLPLPMPLLWQFFSVCSGQVVGQVQPQMWPR